MSYQGDYLPMLLPAFEAATGISVDVQSVPWTEAHEKLLTAFSADSFPDVVMLPNSWVGEFTTIGALAPVRDAALLDDLLPALRGSAIVERTSYAVPWSAAPSVQFFRRDLLGAIGYAAPAGSWDSWRAMAAAMKRRRPDDFTFLMLLNWPASLITMMLQAGAQMLRERNTLGNFSTTEALHALDYYVSLFRDGYAPAVLSTEVSDPLAAFAQGRFAIWPSGPTLLVDLKRRSGEIPPDRWGTARLAGPGGPGVTAAEDVALAVSARSGNPRAAWQLLAHFTSPASELRFAGLIGNLPARQSAWARLGVDTPVLAPFAEQALQTGTTPRVIEWEQIQTEVQLMAERVVRGVEAPRPALAGLDRRVDAILAKRRALVAAGKIA